MNKPQDINFMAISLLLFFLVLFIFFIISLQNTLKAISPGNRKMQPGEVWFIIVPILGVIWQFIVIGRIADSLNDECLQRNIPMKQSKPGFILGAVYCFSYLLCLIPVFAMAGSFIVLITWILYWREINKYKKLLIDTQQ